MITKVSLQYAKQHFFLIYIYAFDRCFIQNFETLHIKLSLDSEIHFYLQPQIRKVGTFCTNSI